jgi:uncharacterized membrane protein YbhN (UPF0104 family)
MNPAAQPEPDPPQSRTATILTAILAAVVLTGSGWILYRQFQTISLHALVTAIQAQAAWPVVVSLLCTAISFAGLASYDAFAARVVTDRVGTGLALLAGATANAISNTLGFHAVTASAVRYRLYGRAGLGLGDIARIISLSGAAIGLSFATTLAGALLLRGEMLTLGIGALLAAVLSAMIWWLRGGRRTVSIFGFAIDLPPARLALIQMGIGLVEMTASIGALYVLLPASLAPPFVSFAIAMTISLVLGVLGHTPGGLGVFEASIVSVLGVGGRADVLAALLVYRVTYYLVPFALSLIALGIHELKPRA